MALTHNTFDSLYNLDDDQSINQVKNDSTEVKDEIKNEIKKNEIKIDKILKKSWADVMDDPLDEEEELVDLNNDRQFPAIEESKKLPNEIKVKMTEEEKIAWREFDKSLASKKTIQITHNIRIYNPETKQDYLEKNTRTLRVVSKATYESFSNLIKKFKTHDKKGYINYKDQSEKIKLTNDLMNMAYKDPNIPCCFIYPVSIIILKNGKRLTRNEVKKDSKCLFSISDLSYYPPFSTV
jgi:hypothetical protein